MDKLLCDLNDPDEAHHIRRELAKYEIAVRVVEVEPHKRLSRLKPVQLWLHNKDDWDLAMYLLGHAMAVTAIDPAQEETSKCLECEYDLRGHSGDGRCPECDFPFFTLSTNERDIPPSTCHACTADIPAGFDVCWQCGHGDPGADTFHPVSDLAQDKADFPIDMLNGALLNATGFLLLPALIAVCLTTYFDVSLGMAYDSVIVPFFFVVAFGWLIFAFGYHTTKKSRQAQTPNETLAFNRIAG